VHGFDGDCQGIGLQPAGNAELHLRGGEGFAGGTARSDRSQTPKPMPYPMIAREVLIPAAKHGVPQAPSRGAGARYNAWAA
jgi:hypothetical protein